MYFDSVYHVFQVGVQFALSDIKQFQIFRTMRSENGHHFWPHIHIIMYINLMPGQHDNIQFTIWKS